MFKNLTVGQKITFGMGTILLLLVVMVVVSFYGMDNTVGHAEEVIYGNEIDARFAQIEVDHLNWVKKLTAFLTDDNVDELSLQFDPAQCGFGKWYHSEDRKQVEKHINGLSAILKDMQEPHKKLHESAKHISEVYRHADDRLPGLLADKKVDHLKWARSIRDTFLLNKDTLEVELDNHKCALGKWLYGNEGRQAYEKGSLAFKQAFDEILEAHRKLHNSAKQIVKDYRQIHPGLKESLFEMDIDNKNWAQKLLAAVEDKDDSLKGILLDPAKCKFGKFLASNQYSEYCGNFPEFKMIFEKMQPINIKLYESAVKIAKALKKTEGAAQARKVYKKETLAYLEQMGNLFDEAINAEDSLMKKRMTAENDFYEVTVPLLHENLNALNKMQAAAQDALNDRRKANNIFASVSQPALKKVQSLLNDARETVKNNIMSQDVMLASAESTNRIISVMGVIAVILGIILLFFITRGITKTLFNIIDNISSGAEQTTSAATQISSSAQQLSQGTTEQASSVEETSSSLDEISSMTKSNSDNASKANQMALEAKNSADKGNMAMEQLETAMNSIADSSEEVKKIIQTIEEIAFQTNLLALNAAVEAARAGEHGKGFAVVAEEVRNLAQRSSVAAKDTAQLIEASSAKTKEGVDYTKKVAQSLTEIISNSGKVADIVGEIAVASKEQADGIGQISTAISQMDQVTQQNAATAEESAAAAEELSSQADLLMEMVDDLEKFAGTVDEVKKKDFSNISKKTLSTSKKTSTFFSKPSANKFENSLNIGKRNSSSIDPEAVIPLENEDFSDF
ncbi:CZB domain-containing protein [bacterium]|nr:CZB domain-containing protein [bacterium]